jgi:hypothetical protein
MPELKISLDGTGAWPDLIQRNVVPGTWTRLSALPHGMASGGLSIGIVVELPDGRVVFAETSWALLYVAARAIEAAYGAPA